MEKRTITPQVKEALQMMANRLPKILIQPNKNNKVTEKIPGKKGKDGGKLVVPKDIKGVPVYSLTLGAALIQNGISFENNEKIIPEKKYRIFVGYQTVDHYRALEKAFLQEGSVGTAKYIQKVQDEAIKNT